MRILLFLSALLCSLNVCFGQMAALKKEIEHIVRGEDLNQIGKVYNNVNRLQNNTIYYTL